MLVVDVEPVTYVRYRSCLPYVCMYVVKLQQPPGMQMQRPHFGGAAPGRNDAVMLVSR
jgi:hypothetical protein